MCCDKVQTYHWIFYELIEDIEDNKFRGDMLKLLINSIWLNCRRKYYRLWHTQIWKVPHGPCNITVSFMNRTKNWVVHNKPSGVNVLWEENKRKTKSKEEGDMVWHQHDNIFFININGSWRTIISDYPWIDGLNWCSKRNLEK